MVVMQKADYSQAWQSAKDIMQKRLIDLAQNQQANDNALANRETLNQQLQNTTQRIDLVLAGIRRLQRTETMLAEAYELSIGTPAEKESQAALADVRVEIDAMQTEHQQLEAYREKTVALQGDNDVAVDVSTKQLRRTQEAFDDASANFAKFDTLHQEAEVARLTTPYLALLEKKAELVANVDAEITEAIESIVTGLSQWPALAEQVLRDVVTVEPDKKTRLINAFINAGYELEDQAAGINDQPFLNLLRSFAASLDGFLVQHAESRAVYKAKALLDGRTASDGAAPPIWKYRDNMLALESMRDKAMLAQKAEAARRMVYERKERQNG